jgi:hypothetical protein
MGINRNVAILGASSEITMDGWNEVATLSNETIRACAGITPALQTLYVTPAGWVSRTPHPDCLISQMSVFPELGEEGVGKLVVSRAKINR